MPRTKKAENVNNDIVIKKSNVDLEKENKKLKDEVESIKILLEQFMSQRENNISNDKKVNVNNIQEKEFVEINANKRIKVVSLYNGTLALTTEKRGGVEYVFHSFGESMMIRYNHLSDILNYYIHFAKMGYFYIYDDQVISNHGLISSYENLLNYEQIDSLLTINKNNLVELLGKTTTQQREEILSWLIEKNNNGESVDLNRLAIIKKLVKQDGTPVVDEDIDEEF